MTPRTHYFALVRPFADATAAEIKKRDLAPNYLQLQALMRELLDGGARDIRTQLTQWAVERNIELG